MIHTRHVSWAGLGLLLAGGLISCKREESSPVPSQAWFRDVTGNLGLNFVHQTGPTGSFFMPASLGSGGALLDFDNDGRLDLYLVNCGAPDALAPNRLFHQEPDGRFRDVSDGSGLAVTGWGMGVGVGDVDNDGLPDLLLTEYGRARLFVNRGNGKFAEVTKESGIDNPRWATAAAFFDYDRDGWLDLVIVNYVDYAPTQKCFDARGAPEFCGPQGMAGTATRLFRNLGAGRSAAAPFQEVTVASGLARKPGPGLGLFCADFDGDRWPDIFVADDGEPNRLFMNQHDGTFLEEAVRRGVAYNAVGATAANMGVAPGDVNGDGWFDLFITHLNWEQPGLWKQGPRGLFQETAAAAGLVNPPGRGTGFGVVLADFDLDGAADLALVNGSIKRVPDPPPALEGLPAFWRSYAQHNQIFVNDGKGSFREVSRANRDFCAAANVGRGLLCGDLDNDGALDLVVLCAGGPARVFRNQTQPRGHWLLVRAVDPALGGRDAYGAEIIIEAGSQRWWRLVQPSYSYLVSNDPRAHFGLGSLSAFQRLLVRWPDGTDEEFPGGPADRVVLIKKGSGRGQKREP